MKSQLAEIGLVTTLLDSGAQDRDDIANGPVLVSLGQLGCAESPGNSWCPADRQRDDIRAERSGSCSDGRAHQAHPTIMEVAVIGSGNGASPKPPSQKYHSGRLNRLQINQRPGLKSYFQLIVLGDEAKSINSRPCTPTDQRTTT